MEEEEGGEGQGVEVYLDYGDHIISTAAPFGTIQTCRGEQQCSAIDPAFLHVHLLSLFPTGQLVSRFPSSSFVCLCCVSVHQKSPIMTTLHAKVPDECVS